MHLQTSMQSRAYPFGGPLRASFWASLAVRYCAALPVRYTAKHDKVRKCAIQLCIIPHNWSCLAGHSWCAACTAHHVLSSAPKCTATLLRFGAVHSFASCHVIPRKNDTCMPDALAFLAHQSSCHVLSSGRTLLPELLVLYLNDQTEATTTVSSQLKPG